jgi:hypothetical protein
MEQLSPRETQDEQGRMAGKEARSRESALRERRTVLKGPRRGMIKYRTKNLRGRRSREGGPNITGT